jgi:hypothetical protein
VYAAKAGALRQFKQVLDRIAGQIRTLSPPQVSEPVWNSELTALSGMSASAAKLADALASGPSAAVSQDLLAFNRAAASNHTVAAQKAQIASVRAYDRDVGRLSYLGHEIEAERLRLANSLK